MPVGEAGAAGVVVERREEPIAGDDEVRRVLPGAAHGLDATLVDPHQEPTIDRDLGLGLDAVAHATHVDGAPVGMIEQALDLASRVLEASEKLSRSADPPGAMPLGSVVSVVSEGRWAHPPRR